MGFQAKIVGDFCNIRCAYCRNRDFDRTNKAVMSLETLEKFLTFLNTMPQKKIRVSWHGGEPLLAGKIFFQNIVKLEKLFPDKVWENSVQTNATLIDSEWASFFSENNFHVSVSVDGNERVHNLDRINALGRGTYKSALRGVNFLREKGIFPGVICTVTKKTACYAEEIFYGLLNAGFKNIAFNAFYNTASEYEADEHALSAQDWFLFLKDIFNFWIIHNDPNVKIRELDALLAWIMGRSVNECSYKGSCYHWFAVDEKGNIYPCERFGKMISYGNIGTLGSYRELLVYSQYLEKKQEMQILPQKCKACKFLSLCYNGGCSHRHADEQGIPLYTYCESRISLYEYMVSRLTNTCGETE